MLAIGFYFASDYFIGAWKSSDICIESYFSENTTDIFVKRDHDTVCWGSNRSEIRRAAKLANTWSETTGQPIGAVCLATPGPFQTLDRLSPNYGKISPLCRKSGWNNLDVRGLFLKHLEHYSKKNLNNNKVILCSRPGATAIGEYNRTIGLKSFDHSRKNSILCVVADDRIKGAIIQGGHILHGRSPAEIGETIVSLAEEETPEFLDTLGDQRLTLNATASLSAIRERWGWSAADFEVCDQPDRIALIAFYVAQALANIILTASPARITIGGRIARNPAFIPHLRGQVKALLLTDTSTGALYPGYEELQDLSSFITRQSDPHSGVKGALFLANRHLEASGTVSEIFGGQHA